LAHLCINHVPEFPCLYIVVCGARSTTFSSTVSLRNSAGEYELSQSIEPFFFVFIGAIGLLGIAFAHGLALAIVISIFAVT
jgi:hypothetical protein